MYILFFNCDIHFFIVCMYVFFIIMFYCVYGQMSEIKNYYYCCHTCVYITTIEGKLVETPSKDPEQLILLLFKKIFILPFAGPGRDYMHLFGLQDHSYVRPQ